MRAECGLWSMLDLCCTQCWEQEIVRKDIHIIAEIRMFMEECVAHSVFMCDTATSNEWSVI